jgi:Tol biopolymer transport system component
VLILGLTGAPSGAGSSPSASLPPPVTWLLADSVASCPAGDSLIAGRPSRLRVVVRYLDGGAAPRVGVPPESLYLRLIALPDPGGLAIHDERVVAGEIRAYAEDSTDAAGDARFTVPSFSGSGRITLRFVISGQPSGDDTIAVRSCDANLDGRVTGADAGVDVNYSGAVDAADVAAISAHVDHGRRGALHGALVRRTSLCGTCPEYSTNTIGESNAAWSPDGKRLAFTLFTGPTSDCTVHLVASDPADGDGLRQFTFPPPEVHDYDPDWSPLGNEIVFDRGDSAIYRKGVPGLNPDTSLHLVTRYDDGTPLHRGDITPAFSPDGRWVAFSRKGPTGFWHLWKIRTEGMEAGATPIQLTSNPYGSDLYPRWTPDGEWIYYDRTNGFRGRRRVYRVRSSGSPEDSVLAPAGAWDAMTPDLSPDGAIVVAGVGPAGFAFTRTLDAALPTQTGLARTVLNYPDYGVEDLDPLPAPRFSPDGTRLALRASPPEAPDELPQIWAARRSMSLPPAIHSVAGRAVPDATPFVDLNAYVGAPLSVQIAASDPEGDPLTHVAYFTRPDLGMSFHAPTATLSWTPPAQAEDSMYTVRFQVTTPSGGTDYALARIHVGSSVGVEPRDRTGHALFLPRPNPFTGSTNIGFELAARTRIRLEILDLQGRRVATLVDAVLPAGRHSVPWGARLAAGESPAAGLYFCRLSAGSYRAQRRLLRLP